MIKEKQIELLEKQLAFWKSQTTCLIKALDVAEHQAKQYAELLDKTEEELNGERVERGWIGVDERLPDREGKYLAYTTRGTVEMARCYTYHVDDKPQFDYWITHWMPLPEAPKGGAE